MTKSEENTIKLFKEIGLDLVRVKERAEKTPDFFVETDKQKIFIEVKEINENKEEKDFLLKIDNKEKISAFDSPEIGKRFRPPINAANKQLKSSCKSNEAGLIIIQDIRNFLNRSECPHEEVKLAMFGDRVTWLNVGTGQFEADLFDKNKTTTEQKNTTTSAVCLLTKDLENGNLKLHIYHNPYAKVPLISPVFKSSKVSEYSIHITKAYSNFKKK